MAGLVHGLENGWLHQFYSYMVTVIAIVFSDLLTGIGLGILVAVMFILWNNFKTPYHFDPKKVKAGEPIRIQLSEDVSFLNKAGFIKTFGLLPEDSHVIIDATRTKDIHWDVLELIEDFKINAKSKNILLELEGFRKSNNGNVVSVLHAHVQP